MLRGLDLSLRVMVIRNKALDSENLIRTAWGYSRERIFFKNFLPLTMIADDCSADIKTAFWYWKTGFWTSLRFKEE